MSVLKVHFLHGFEPFRGVAILCSRCVKDTLKTTSRGSFCFPLPAGLSTLKVGVWSQDTEGQPIRVVLFQHF